MGYTLCDVRFVLSHYDTLPHTIRIVHRIAALADAFKMLSLNKRTLQTFDGALVQINREELYHNQSCIGPHRTPDLLLDFPRSRRHHPCPPHHLQL